MGEAKRRVQEITKIKNEFKTWQESLTSDEKLVAEIAIRLEERLVRGRRFYGGCYHLAFFMTHHLSLQGINLRPVIGWVNDGLWQGMTSHAWIEFNGRKTDVSLTYCDQSDVIPTGELIVHDRVIRHGKASYTYYEHNDPAAQAGLKWMQEQSQLQAVIQKKMIEHERMRNIVANRTFKEYLENAPHGGRYSEITALIS